MKRALSTVEYTLRRPLVTAHGRMTVRTGWRVTLVRAGRTGTGVALPLPGFTESPSSCLEALDREPALGSLEALAASLSGLEDTPCARNALETAALDLISQERGVPLTVLLAPEARSSVEVNGLLAGEGVEDLARSVTLALARGLSTLKIKVAGRPLSEDVERVAAVRDRVGPDVRLRLDANGGWTTDEALGALDALAAFDPELCEQPVTGSAALAALAPRSPVPVAADEALLELDAQAVLLDAPIAALVLKPAALGGLLPCLTLAREAATRGIASYVTTLVDGPIARAAAAHLACALPTSPLAHGLDTPALLHGTGFDPYTPTDGRITLPRAPGLGSISR